MESGSDAHSEGNEYKRINITAFWYQLVVVERSLSMRDGTEGHQLIVYTSITVHFFLLKPKMFVQTTRWVSRQLYLLQFFGVVVWMSLDG